MRDLITIHRVQSAKRDFDWVFENFSRPTVERLVDFEILECYDTSKVGDVVVYYYRKVR